MIVDFETAKSEFATILKRMVADRINASKRCLLDDWIETISSSELKDLAFSFSPREFDDYYNEDEIVFSKTFYFYGGQYLRQCCSPGGDSIAGKRCIPIGGVDGADEFLYMTDSPNLNVALLHHEDVFLAEDLDTVVVESTSGLEISLQQFVDLLRPQTNFAKFTAIADASKWLIVEDLGGCVRYEINLTDHSNDGEKSFASSADSEAFFFDMIQKGCATTRLSILDCSPHLRGRIEAILNLGADT